MSTCGFRGLCGVMVKILPSDTLEVEYSVIDDFGNACIIDPHNGAVDFITSDQTI